MNPDIWAASYGLRVLSAFPTPGHYLVQAPSVVVATWVVETFRNDQAVISAFQDQIVERKRWSFSANDPYLHHNGAFLGSAGQWNLINEIGTGIDVRVAPAWNRNLTGSGVVIGIIDDGFEWGHPDLYPNYSPSQSFDFGSRKPNPGPVYASDNHGTAVAGIAVARGGNGIGITGVAPFASFAGLRCDFNTSPASAFAEATRYHSISSNHSIAVKNHSYGTDVIFDTAPEELSALTDSSAAGTIHVFAAGNSRGTSAQDCSKEILLSSPDAVVVAALGANGKFASYSDFGANVFVTAPSSSDGQPSILTTDRLGNFGFNGTEANLSKDYTSQFGGTSASAPLVSGAAAIVKQLRPTANTRYFKHLLARTSDPIDAYDTTDSGDNGWKPNGAGLRFDPNYGFGLLNIDRLTQMAALYEQVSPLETEGTGTISVSQPISEEDNGTTQSFILRKTTPVEEVQVHLRITHPRRGALVAYLTSPSGTRSRLFAPSATDRVKNLDWVFTTNAFWGEIPAGTWKLSVQDSAGIGGGIWNAFEVQTCNGKLLPVTVDHSSFAAQSLPGALVPGQSFPASFTLNNDGPTKWSGPIWALVPADGANYWGMGYAPLSRGETVPASSQRTFDLKLAAPTTPGYYPFQWMMSGPNGNFGVPSTQYVILVAHPLDGVIASQTVPTSMTPRKVYTVTVTAKNLGSTEWSGAGNFGLISADGTVNWGFSTVAWNSSETTGYGGYRTFTFQVTAPRNPGNYSFQWKLRQAGRVFGSVGPRVQVSVR